MLRWFKHDGKLYEVKDVIEHNVLSEYYPLAYLKVVSDEREWKGRPGVTQLIQGTREAFLKILTDYAIDPDDDAFKVHGTLSHEQLEIASDGKMAEFKLATEDIAGVADIIEKQPNGEYWIIDYKRIGAFAVAKALGLSKKKVPMLDKNGNQLYYDRGGRYWKKGDPRTETVYEIDPSKAEKIDWTLQLNEYRMLAKEIYDIDITRMRIFCIIRDGGTHTARSYGIDTRTRYIEIERMPDDEVRNYFEYKSYRLLSSLDAFDDEVEIGLSKGISGEEGIRRALKLTVPERCTNHESWDGRKCEKYCDVRDTCLQLYKEGKNAEI